VANIDLLELLPWSMPNGIRIDQTKLSVDELKSTLEVEPLDRQVVASEAGILLEKILDHLALIYGCKVPRQATAQYTLGVLFDGLSRQLKSALKIAKLKDDGTLDSEDNLGPMLTPLNEITWIRNQVGCHFSLDDSTSTSEVSDFGAKVLTLCEAVICQECGELPGKNKSGSFWGCHCKKTQLHPLEMPR
jgi:hypothetical protein